MEPIIIVIMLAIIFGMALLFYARISGTQQKTEASHYQAEEDLDTLDRLTTMPELSCPRSETVKTYCIDRLKAEAFAGMLDNGGNRIYYTPLLGDTSITLIWYDLNDDALHSLPIYNNLKDSTRVKATRTYFTVFDPITGTRQFAMLNVERQQ
jgi:hypothetical protein